MTKKFFRLAVYLLLALSMVCSMVQGTFTNVYAEEEEGSLVVDGLEEEADSADGPLTLLGDGLNQDVDATLLYQYITALTITKDGAPVTAASELYEGDNLKLDFNWTIQGGVYKDNKTYTYTLPLTFKTEQNVSGLVMQGSKSVGTFTVGDDGRTVTIQYDDDYNTSNNTIINTMSISGTAKYVSGLEFDDAKLLYGNEYETIVVLNDGDYTVEKRAVLRYENDQLDEDSWIEYEVLISSAYGTNGDFTISDVIKNRLSNTKNTTIFEFYQYDPNTFSITDAQGNIVNGWSISYAEDNHQFTIINLPALGENGSYTLRYRVNVSEVSQGLGNYDEFLDNTVTVSNESGKSKSDDASVKYTKKISKSAGTYNQVTGIPWTITINNKNTDISGYVFTDSFENGVLSSSVRLTASDAGGNQKWFIEMNPVTTTDGTVTSFSFTMPENYDYSLIDHLSVTYKTTPLFADDETDVTVSNVSMIQKDSTLSPTEDIWYASGVGKASRKGSAALEKQALGYEQDDSDKITMNWGMNVAFSNLTNQEVSVIDEIGNAVWYSNTTYNTGVVQTNYTSDHYAIAADLNAALEEEGNVILTFLDESGEEVKMSLAKARAAGYTVQFLYYSSKSRTEKNLVNSSDTQKAVRAFVVSVSSEKKDEAGNPIPLELVNLKIEKYPTYLSTEHILPGVKWNVSNTATSLDTKVEASQDYTESAVEMIKLVRGNDSSGKGAWLSSGAVFEDVNEDTRIRYRIIVTVPEGQTSVTVTDLIPKGLVLATDKINQESFWGYSNIDGTETRWDTTKKSYVSNWNGGISVGLFTGTVPIYGNDNYRKWFDSRRKEHISYTYDEETGEFSLTIDGLGSELPLYGTRKIAIEYECAVVSNLEDFADTTQTIDQSANKVTVTASLINHAAFEDFEAEADITVTQEKNVLSKGGEQVVVDGVTYQKVHYSVEINEPGLDLLEDGDFLTLTDTIVSTDLLFTLDRSSFKLYERNEDGSRGAEVTPYEVNISQPDDDGTKQTQSFTIKVRDQQSYILEYDYTILGTRIESVTAGKMSNTISLDGVIEKSTETAVEKITAQASSDHGALNLYKVDSKNNTIYLSAKFRLERYDFNQNAFVTVDGMENFEISGSDGISMEYFGSQAILDGNTLYRVVEVTQPDGYRLSEIPYYFIVCGNIEEVRAQDDNLASLIISTESQAKIDAYGNREILGTGTDAVNVAEIVIDMLKPNSTGTFEIKNEKIEYDIEVVKVDHSDTEIVLEGVTFALWKVDEQSTENIPQTEVKGVLVDSLTTGANGKNTFYQLTPGTYYLFEMETLEDYVLLETPIPLVIDENGIVIAEDASNQLKDMVQLQGTELLVKNQKKRLFYELPETGGRGMPLFYGLILLMSFLGFGIFLHQRNGKSIA